MQKINNNMSKNSWLHSSVEEYDIACNIQQPSFEEQLYPTGATVQSPRHNNKFYSLDCCKNICSYVTKKALRQFRNKDSKEIRRSLCNHFMVQIECVEKKAKKAQDLISGPKALVRFVKGEDVEIQGVRSVLLVYLLWYLRERYIRSIASQGKMSSQYNYIKYVNQQLYPILTINITPQIKNAVLFIIEGEGIIQKI